jgi:protein TonB
VNQTDRRPSLRRNYYRNVRNAFVVAGVVHAAGFAFAPSYLPTPAVMKREALRLLPAGWSASASELSVSGAAPASPADLAPRASALAGVLALPEREVVSEQWAPAGSAAPAGAETRPGGGGDALESNAPPVYYGYDVAPRALRTFEPLYPAMARESGFEGTVVINVNLDERGSILRAWVAASNAPDLLVATALEAIYQFEFAPGSARGIAVRSTVAVPFRFLLKRNTP